MTLIALLIVIIVIATGTWIITSYRRNSKKSEIRKLELDAAFSGGHSESTHLFAGDSDTEY